MALGTKPRCLNLSPPSPCSHIPGAPCPAHPRAHSVPSSSAQLCAHTRESSLGPPVPRPAPRLRGCLSLSPGRRCEPVKFKLRKEHLRQRHDSCLGGDEHCFRVCSSRRGATPRRESDPQRPGTEGMGPRVCVTAGDRQAQWSCASGRVSLPPPLSTRQRSLVRATVCAASASSVPVPRGPSFPQKSRMSVCAPLE